MRPSIDRLHPRQDPEDEPRTHAHPYQASLRLIGPCSSFIISPHNFSVSFSQSSPRWHPSPRPCVETSLNVH